MKWEEFKRRGPRSVQFEKYETTNIECPECGSLIYRRADITLTTNPPMSRYECLNCGWWGAK